jgi:hypothetical protein
MSSPAKAGDPVNGGVGDSSQAAPRTGCLAFAGHDKRFLVIPVRAQRESGIHNRGRGLWIPGLRQAAHPGMTEF